MAGLSSSGAAGSGKLEAQPGQSLVEGLSGPAESIHQRFPGLDGVLLQEQVFAAYKLEVADHIPYLKSILVAAPDSQQEIQLDHLYCHAEQMAMIEVNGSSCNSRISSSMPQST